MKLDMLSYLGTDYAKDKQLIKKILSNPSILVGWVDSFNAENGTVNVQPAIQDKIIDENAVLNYVNKPYLINCWVIANTLNRQPQTGDKALILVLDEKSNNFFKSQYDNTKPLSLQTFVNTSKNVKSLSNCVAIIINSDFIKDIGTIVNVGGVAQSEINFTSDPQTQINNVVQEIENITDNISTLQSDIEELGNELNTTNSNLTTETENLQNQINNINNSIWEYVGKFSLSSTSQYWDISYDFDFNTYDYYLFGFLQSDSSSDASFQLLDSTSSVIDGTMRWIQIRGNSSLSADGSYSPSGYVVISDADNIYLCDAIGSGRTFYTEIYMYINPNDTDRIWFKTSCGGAYYGNSKYYNGIGFFYGITPANIQGLEFGSNFTTGTQLRLYRRNKNG